MTDGELQTARKGDAAASTAPTQTASPTAASQSSATSPIAAPPIPPTQFSNSPPDIEKQDLEKQKLRLEVANLRRWWVPFIPAGLTTLGLAIAFLAAWRTGVFEARNLKLQADNTLLEVRKAKLETDVLAFTKTKEEIIAKNSAMQTELADLSSRISEAQRELQSGDFGTFLRKLKADGKTTSYAFDDVVRALKQEDSDQHKRLVFLDQSLGHPTTPRDVALLLYARYVALREPEIKGRIIADLTAAASRITSTDAGGETSAIAILGDSRWTDKEREELVPRLIDIAASPEAPPAIRAVMLRLVAQLHTVNWNFRSGRQFQRSPNWFRLDIYDWTRFQRFVILARSLMLDPALPDDVRGSAVRALAHVAPPAFVAVLSEMLRTTPLYPSRLGIPVQQAMDFVNTTMHDRAKGPASPKGHETALDEYDSSTHSAWKTWNEQHGDALKMWLEKDLNTLRNNPGWYAALFDDYIG
jgi:hypothetical protein